jgi:hypothetical protein
MRLSFLWFLSAVLAHVDINEQKNVASHFWPYRWTPGGAREDVGTLQIVNGVNQPIWIRYTGTDNTWLKYIQQPSALNGFQEHAWTSSKNLQGQGDGFRLGIGEYQIVPLFGIGAWLSASMGCCQDGSQCTINQLGRGGTNTIFEWTVAPAGVWDFSAVDGFDLSMHIETQESVTPDVSFNADHSICPNPEYNNKNEYIGCMSMCRCQQTADQATGQNTNCKLMTNIHEPHMRASKGYCGCPGERNAVTGCEPEPEASHKFYAGDKAGQDFCNVITKASNINGERATYCYSYDDAFGTRSLGNGNLKLTVLTNRFADVIEKQCQGVCYDSSSDKQKIPSLPTTVSPTPILPTVSPTPILPTASRPTPTENLLALASTISITGTVNIYISH